MRSMGADPDPSAVDEAIALAAGYILAHQRSDGSFVYRALASGPLRRPQGYNILRHAGTMYAMAQALEAGLVGDAGRAVLRRGASYLADRLVPLPDAPGCVAVATVGRIDGGRDDEAKLGAAGLGLVALVATERWCPGTVPGRVLCGLGDFLIHLQSDEGEFLSKYRLADPVGPIVDWRSLFYPGEAALGLLELAAIEDDERYGRAAIDGLLFLARSRAGDPEVPPDHWALLATARALQADRPDLSPAELDLLTGHGRQVCQRILDDAAGATERFGALTSTRSVCSTATVLEGLLAARSSLDLGRLDRPVATRIDDGISFLLASQLRHGPAAGGFLPVGPVDGVDLVDPPEPTEPEIRIDAVQHCLSAFIGHRHQPGSRQRPDRSPSATDAGLRRPDLGPVWSIDVRPYADRVSSFLEATTPTGAGIWPLVDHERPGLFQLATEIADHERHVLYTAQLTVIWPGAHTEHPPVRDRRAWGCHRWRVILSGDGWVEIGRGPGAVKLLAGDVHRLDPIGSFVVENRTTDPVVALDVLSRPKPATLIAAPFELMESGIDVAPMAAELEALIAESTEDERSLLLVPFRQTDNMKLRTEWQIIGGGPATAGELQRSHYTALCHRLPLLYGWLDAYCLRSNLDPGRARIVMMRPGGHAVAHYDGGSYYRRRDRYLLVVTGGASTLTAGPETIRPQPGELWRFDNQLLHDATNYGTEPRVHLYFDANPWSGS